MGKNPLMGYVESYMRSVRTRYADETKDNRLRRYKRMDKKLVDLRESKRISTTSPKSLTETDVREYIIYCEEECKQAQSDMVHEVNALKEICRFCGNDAVDKLLMHEPGIKPTSKGRVRLPTMSDETYELILDRSREIDPTDFYLNRAYTLVLICINIGTRNKEIRMAEVNDLDTRGWLFSIIHVKGEDSYGQPRDVPVPPEIRNLLVNYLLLRQKFVVDKKLDSNALFPSEKSADGHLSSNGVRRIKEVVERDLGIKFDLRTCRRTFGQRYLDKGLDIESTSVLMGHSTTKTTESFYSRKKNKHAIDNAMQVWDDNGGQRFDSPFWVSG